MQEQFERHASITSPRAAAPPGGEPAVSTLIARAAGAYRRLSRAWLTAAQRMIPSERQRLFGLTIAIGGVCGLVAVAFHVAIQALSAATIDRAMAAPGYTWIGWTLAVPTLGALVAGFVLQRVVPAARGSGIPQVKVAYTAPVGRLRLRDSLGKFAIGVLQIGTGSSLGREGPTVQICAGVATGLGRLAGVSQRNLRRLIPVGAAAGVAAAFNAPIAAVTFVIEEIVGTLDQTLLSGVIVAAALAAVVEHIVLGGHPVFDVPPGPGLGAASSLVSYAVLGIAAAAVAVAFNESLLGLRGWFARVRRVPRWAHPAIGALATAGLAVIAIAALGSGGITGGGYRALGDALAGALAPRVLLGLGALKLLATVASYSSGGAGGIFAPALFLGGMLGGAVGSLDVALFGHPQTEVASFALVGMGAVFAGVVRAPITSVLIIIEMTNGYSLILPLMIANMSAYGLARRLRPVPIYEALLAQDGVHLAGQAHGHPAGKSPEIDAIDALALGELESLDRDYVAFRPEMPAAVLLAESATAGRQEIFPVTEPGGALIGLIALDDLSVLAAEPPLHDGLVNAADVMRPPIALRERDTLRAAYELLVSSGVRELPIVDEERRVIGLVSEVAIAHTYLQARRRLRSDAAPITPGGD